MKTRELASRAAFAAYERVRTSGATNMWDVQQVCALSGLDGETVRLIMKRYRVHMGRERQAAQGEESA